jgi:TonB family protein
MSVTSAAFLFLFLAGAWTLWAQEGPRAADSPLRMDERVTRPVRISGAPPVFPEEARKAGVQGSVILEAIIDEHGDVRDAKVVKSLTPDLDQAALDAVKTWKFKPAIFEHCPVKVYYTLTVHFVNQDVGWKQSYGPQFRRFLAQNLDFAQLLVSSRYQDASQLLDRLAAKQSGASEIALARTYLLLEQGRLKEAWLDIQSDRGPDPFERLCIFGYYVWRSVYSSKDLSRQARAELIDLGLQAESDAMAAQTDELAPIILKGRLLLEKAKLTSDRGERQALAVEMTRLLDLGKRLTARGKSPGPFPVEPPSPPAPETSPPQ